MSSSRSEGSPTVEDVAIDGGVAASLMLASERVTSAQTLLSLRELERQVLVAQVRAHFEEGGVFVVHELDPTHGVVRRSRRPPPPNVPGATQTATNGSS